MTVRNWHFLMLATILLLFSECKKKEHSAVGSIPQVTTQPVTNITTSSATAGGMITNNGGSAVIRSGICWSRTNNTPTIADDTLQGGTPIGIYTFVMNNLEHDVTYYVRAFAVNRAGIGYGQMLSFTTGNAAPLARNLTFFGDVSVNKTVKVRYEYFDEENNPQAGTGFQWYVTTDTVAGTISTIASATDSAYRIAPADKDKFLRVNITPRSSAGTSPGTVVASKWIGPVVAERDSVTFVYNGQTVTYFTITSPVTGRKWLDRNLGSPNTPTAWNDWQNYGDLFQWGRGDDGHQLIIRAANTNSTTAVNDTTSVRVSSDNPGHSLFIITTADPFNWRLPANDQLWLPPARTNNPCPAGYHVPTLQEWFDENLGGLTTSFQQLKITAGGIRNASDGSFAFTQTDGLYWTSLRNPGTWVSVQFNFPMGSGGLAYGQASMRTNGLCVRCIQD